MPESDAGGREPRPIDFDATLTLKDWAGLDRLEREIRAHPDKHARISCFNEGEAHWIRDGLRRRGIAADRMSFSWLNFKPRPTPSTTGGPGA